MFHNVSKVVFCGNRNTLASFSEDELQFSWQAQHFGRVHRHFSWQAQHFRRVVLRFFCKSHWQGCVKWRQGANSVAGVTFCEMCWKLTEASHETLILRLQNLEVPKKTRRNYKVWKLEDVSHEMLVLRLQHVSSRFSGFLVASLCLLGEGAKLLLLESIKAGCNAGLRGRHSTSWHSHVSANVPKDILCGRRNTFASFLKDELHFRGRSSTLETSIAILRGRRNNWWWSVVSGMLFCVAA